MKADRTSALPAPARTPWRLQHFFQLSTRVDRVYQFATETARLMREWIDAFSTAISNQLVLAGPCSREARAAVPTVR